MTPTNPDKEPDDMVTLTFYYRQGGGIATNLPAADAHRLAAVVNKAIADPARHNETVTITPDRGGRHEIRIGDLARATVT